MTNQPYEPTVYILDDDASVRRGLVRLLRSGHYLTREFANPADFLAACSEDMRGCLILDVAMPGMDGLEVQEVLAGTACRLPIVFLTGHGDVPMSVKAMKGGAADFLMKPVKGSVLLEAVATAIRKDRQRFLARNGQDDIRNRLATLTVREHEVMLGVVRGKLNKQVADDLGIALKTVKVHRGRVMQKMGVQSLAELVQIAIRLGVIPDDNPSS